MAEKGTEYEVAKDDEEEMPDIEGDEEKTDLNIGRVTIETGSIESEEISIAASQVRNYGVLDDDEEEDLKI